VTSDRGGIVIGWLTKLIAVVSIGGLIAFDLISLGTSRLQAEDHAHTAARAAVEAYGGPRTVQVAYDAALAEVLADGDTIDAQSFAFAADGSVTLTLRRTAPTLVVRRISALREHAEVTRTVTQRRSS
jgi:hypothetical protein